MRNGVKLMEGQKWFWGLKKRCNRHDQKKTNTMGVWCKNHDDNGIFSYVK